ncbi:hypothetical protein QQ045_025545 [Rhodiola kirilowii]
MLNSTAIADWAWLVGSVYLPIFPMAGGGMLCLSIDIVFKSESWDKEMESRCLSGKRDSEIEDGEELKRSVKRKREKDIRTISHASRVWVLYEAVLWLTLLFVYYFIKL